jgi:hypothetical protein
MLTREEALNIVGNLPDKFSFDDILDRLMLLNKINAGIKQSERNEILSTSEVEKHFEKWFE